MRTLQHLLDGKARRVISVSPGDDVFLALELMARHDIGALLVVEDGRPVGVFSERDYARKVVLHGKKSKETAVREVMSPNLIWVGLEQTVEECMAIMTERHVRHLPVLTAEGTVAGFLSIGDLVKETIADQKFTIEQLVHYITH